jgi:transcriptional regulator with XRE-family HTH domain
MTKTIEEVSKFIELRARGWSFDKIAIELQVSKPTLLKWERENESTLAEARALELQAVLERHKLMRLERAEALSSLLSSVLEEVKRRGEKLQNLSTDKLVDLALTLESRLAKEAEVHLSSPLEQALYGAGDAGSNITVD